MSTLTIRSLAELQRALKALEREMEREVTRAIRKTARFGVREIRKTARETSPRPRSMGLYEDGWQARTTKDGAVIFNPVRHAEFVEKGRRPGKAPPIGPLRRWVMRKRLALKPSVAERIARAIAKKIAKRGVKGRFVLARTMPRIIKKLERSIEQVIARHAAHPPRA